MQPQIFHSGHFLFDLPAYITRRLGDAGVAMIQRCPNDTVAEEERFFQLPPVLPARRG